MVGIFLEGMGRKEGYSIYRILGGGGLDIYSVSYLGWGGIGLSFSPEGRRI